MSFLLNFSPIRFDDSEITVGQLPYGDNGEEVLKRLRKQHNATHVFRREGADTILAVPVAPGASLIGEPTTVQLKKHLGLASGLVRNALITYLAGMGRTVLSYDPVKFIARHDLLRVNPPPGTVPPDWLAVRLLYEVAVRPIYFFKQEPFVAAVLDVRTTRLIERSAWDLMQEGFSVEGLYVGRRVRNSDPRIAPRLELLGCVKSTAGSQLHLTDCREDVEIVEARNAWLEKRVFASCLSHAFGGRASEVAEALERERAALVHGPTRLDRITKTIDFLASKHYEMVPGLPFTFGPLLDSANGSFPCLDSAPRPDYVFDETGLKTDTWHDRGLTQHGPYTAKVFTPNQPRICVVCQQSKKGQVEQFLHKFVHGIKSASLPGYRGGSPKLQTNYFEKGFCRKYALKDIHCEFFLAENNSVESYRKACQTALEEVGRGQKWDLAMIQIEEPFHRLPAKRNPYFVSKVSFHTHQIPVQEFEIETTFRADRELIYVLNNMGLATYAKLNGTPWLLKANPTIAHELVIGLGSANVGESRLGLQERFVGITTVFSGDGNYHLSNLSKAASIDEYETALLTSLRAAILKVRTDMNWQPKDHVRLVFHATFKRFSREEVQSIKGLLTDLGDYDVEYAFVQVSEDHPYMLFDMQQNGVYDYETKRIKGIYAPEKGRYLELGNWEVLLSLTGPREVKRPADGTPRPLFLSLHRDSTFTDMTYLTRQVFTFACHSWRTFLPASVPVTIQYSNLIANALGHLSLMDRWNPEVMLGRIGKTRWFL